MLKASGLSDVFAREIVGHESAAISRQYTHLTTDDLRTARIGRRAPIFARGGRPLGHSGSLRLNDGQIRPGSVRSTLERTDELYNEKKTRQHRWQAMNTKEELDAFRDRFLKYPDAFIEAQIRNGTLDNAHREVLLSMLDERRRAAVKAEQQRYDQAERHHREAKGLAWTAAIISVVSALAALISALFAWHPPHPPQPPVAPAPTPLVVVASPSPARVSNPVDYISCRQTKLDEDGAVRMTIRNNNGFPIRNISLRIVFMPASRVVSEPVYEFQWFIPELIQSGEDLEFTAADASSSSNILASHSHDSTDEWLAKAEFISAESVPK